MSDERLPADYYNDNRKKEEALPNTSGVFIQIPLWSNHPVHGPNQRENPWVRADHIVAIQERTATQYKSSEEYTKARDYSTSKEERDGLGTKVKITEVTIKGVEYDNEGSWTLLSSATARQLINSICWVMHGFRPNSIGS